MREERREKREDRYLTEDHRQLIVFVTEDMAELHLKQSDIFQQILGVPQLAGILSILYHDGGPVKWLPPKALIGSSLAFFHSQLKVFENIF